MNAKEGEKTEKKRIVTRILNTKKFHKIAGEKKEKTKTQMRNDASLSKKTKGNAKSKSDLNDSNEIPISVLKTLSSPEIYLQTQNKSVPLRYTALKALIDKLEYLNAVQCHGIFRQSGHATSVELIVKSLGEPYPVSNIKTNDKTFQGGVHEYSCALKQYLREAPDPIIPFADVPKFLQDLDNPDPFLRLFRVVQAVLELPRENQLMLKMLIKFLKKIEENSDVNLMTANNLAISLGPSVLRQGACTFAQTGWCCEVLVLLLNNCHDIFSELTEDNSDEFHSPRVESEKKKFYTESVNMEGSLRPVFSSETIPIQFEEEEEEVDLFEFLRGSAKTPQPSTVL